MKGYLSIGKVSKLKNVSIKSLRYYDRIGVFSPAYINQETNYRYYTPEQLYLLDAIQLCIELGIPLRDLESYKEAGGALNIRKLLFDGKDLAERKIRTMQQTIEVLQSTLARIEAGESTVAEPLPDKMFSATAARAVSGESKTSSKKATTKKTAKKKASDDNRMQKTLEERIVIVTEFDEVTTANRYNHMLLSIFVNAEKQGLSAGYPSGLLYTHEMGETKKYVFATLTEGNKDNLPENCRILPKADYYFARDKEHKIEDAAAVFAPCFQEGLPEQYMLIETDVLQAEEKGWKELQLLSM